MLLIPKSRHLALPRRGPPAQSQSASARRDSQAPNPPQTFRKGWFPGPRDRLGKEKKPLCSLAAGGRPPCLSRWIAADPGAPDLRHLVGALGGEVRRVFWVGVGPRAGVSGTVQQTTTAPIPTSACEAPSLSQPLPLPKMAVVPLPPPPPLPRFLRPALLQSAADNCLGPRAVPPPANEERQRGAARLGSSRRGPMEAQRVGGRRVRPPMGRYGARPGPGGCAARRARFSRETAAAVEEEVEDVGHARTGGGAGSERAARQPGAAAGRLRRYGGAGVRAPGCPGAMLNVTKPTSG